MIYIKLKLDTPYILLLSAFLWCALLGCKKYDEGPGVSLKSKTGRLVRQWKTIIAADQTLKPEEQDQNFFEFEKDGTFSVNELRISTTISLRGTWEWVDNKESIKIDIQGVDQQEWKVLRLTKDELWFSDEDNLRWELEEK